jgi:flagellar hook-associated protein 3 FlgL
MSITGPGSLTAANLLAQNSLNTQLQTLSEQLSTGQEAQTYSGLGSQAGLALSLNAQLSEISGYSNTATTVGTTLSIAQSVLSQLSSVSTDMEQSVAQQGAYDLDNNGQTTTQQTAAANLDQILSLLNTQVGGNYIFSGSGTNQPSVASTSEILNGNGSQAGLTQVITERQEADQGTNGLGRLTISSSGSTVNVGQDGSPFGFQLAGVNSGLTGATVTGPSGSPPSLSVAMTSNPSAGQTIAFQLTLPDGSSQTITLQATTDSPPGANQFTIGSSATATASNLQSALTSAVSTLAQTALPAASAVEAADNFFNNDPPMRVSGSDPATSMSLVAGTSANTVIWYTGENGSTPALQTATAQVGPSTTISYGMRANEQAFTSLLANVGVLAAASFSASDSNAEASYEALCSSVTAGLSGQSGIQSISDVEAQIANAQTTVTNATSLNTQTQNTAQDMLQSIDGINDNAVSEQILTLQNQLSASMEVTARLAQLSLVNYLGAVSG